MSRVDDMWKMLAAYGITTMEQFEEAYKKCPKIDITPFVAVIPETEEEKAKEKRGA